MISFDLLKQKFRVLTRDVSVMEIASAYRNIHFALGLFTTLPLGNTLLLYHDIILPVSLRDSCLFLPHLRIQLTRHLVHYLTSKASIDYTSLQS